MRTVRLPILLSSSIVIIALCLLAYSWAHSTQRSQQQQFLIEYSQGLADTSAAFLGQLIDEQDANALSTVGEQLVSQEHISKLSIYQRNGELLYQEGHTATPDEHPVIANIAYNNHYNGYLILYFSSPGEIFSDQQVIWHRPEVILAFGALILVLLTFILYAGRLFSRSPKNITPRQKAKKSEDSNIQLIKNLIKRKKDYSNTEVVSSIIIKAHWTKLDNQSTNQLLRVLNRWLPQNGLFVTQFQKQLLKFGLKRERAPISQGSLYALDHCLHRLQLEPKIILHRLNFGEEIYQMFFDIIETGIWFEKRLIETGSDYKWFSDKVIDIELDDGTIVELCRLKAPDAEQKSLIERQVRFLSDD